MAKMLTLTENTLVAVVDSDGRVLGTTAGEVLTYDDAELREDLRGFGASNVTLTLWLLPEWAGMSDSQRWHLPRSVEALEAYGATAERTIQK